MIGPEKLPGFPGNFAALALLDTDTPAPRINVENAVILTQEEATRRQTQRGISLLARYGMPQERDDTTVSGAKRRNYPDISIPLPDDRGTLLIGAQRLQYKGDSEEPVRGEGIITVNQQIGSMEDATLFEILCLRPGIGCFYGVDTQKIYPPEEINRLLAISSGIWDYAEAYMDNLEPSLPPAARAVIEKNAWIAEEMHIQGETIKGLTTRGVMLLDHYGTGHSDGDARLGRVRKKFDPLYIPLGEPQEGRWLEIDGAGFLYTPDSEHPATGEGAIIVNQLIERPTEPERHELFRLQPGRTRFLNPRNNPLSLSIESTHAYIEALGGEEGVWDFAEGYLREATAGGKIPPAPQI